MHGLSTLCTLWSNHLITQHTLVESSTTTSLTVRSWTVVAKVAVALWTAAVALLVFISEATATTTSTTVTAPAAIAVSAAVAAATTTVPAAVAATLVIPWTTSASALLIPTARAAALTASKVTAAVAESSAAASSAPVAPTVLSVLASPATASLAAVTLTTATASSRTSASATSALSIHILLGNSLLHVQGLVLDGVGLLKDDFVNGIVVIELNEGEAALLAGVLVGNNVHAHDLAKVLEVLAQALFIVIVSKPAHKELLYRGSRIRGIDLLAWHSPLGLHGASIDLVWPGILRIVDHVRLGVRDETEAARALRLGILHHHHVDNVAPLLEVSLQAIICGAVVQSADEQFAQLLWLGDLRVNFKCIS